MLWLGVKLQKYVIFMKNEKKIWLQIHWLVAIVTSRLAINSHKQIFGTVRIGHQLSQANFGVRSKWSPIVTSTLFFCFWLLPTTSVTNFIQTWRFCNSYSLKTKISLNKKRQMVSNYGNFVIWHEQSFDLKIRGLRGQFICLALFFAEKRHFDVKNLCQITRLL